MLPSKLTHGDNLQNLFQKFNTVIDYLREIRLVAGNGIRINHLPAGTTIESTTTATGGGSPSVSAYSGMFQLKLSTGEEGNSVSVIDGMDPDADECGIVGYGGESYSVPVWNAAVSQGIEWYIYLVKTAEGFAVIKSGEQLGFSRHVPNILIGRVDYTGSMCKVFQDHVTGPVNVEAPYDGMFGIVVNADTSGNTISYKYKVSGGLAYANAFGFEVAELTGTVSNGTKYIYWSIEYDTSDYTFQNSTLQEYSAAQTDTQYKKFLLIGTITRNGSLIQVKQNHNGQIQVFFWGDCEHDV